MPPASTAQFDLLVLAELNPDVVVLDRSLEVRFGQVEQIVDGAVLTLGSSGAITAAAAATQGLRVAVCAVVGDDAAGAFAVDQLQRLGVDTGAVITVAGAATGMTIVLSRTGGDRALLTFPGTMADLTADAVPPALLDRARHVHISSYYLQTGLQAGLPALADTVRRRGGTVSLDPGWDPAEEWAALAPVLDRIDYLLPNAAELRHLVRTLDLDGVDIADGTGPAEAARAVAALGPAVVAKLGADGGLYADARGVWSCAGEPVPEADVVDTTGAGDNFDAGFLAALLSGHPGPDALAAAVASGAISLGGRGGTGRMAGRDEALATAARLPVQVMRSGSVLADAAATASSQGIR